MMKWANGKSWKEQIEAIGAEGIDFFCFGESTPCKIMTKEDLLNGEIIPKTPYKFWKLINGEKYYIELDYASNQPEETHTINIYAPLEYLCGRLRYGYYEGKLHLSTAEFNTFKQSPKDFLYDFEYLNKLNLAIEDYDIDDIGPIDYVEWKEEGKV